VIVARVLPDARNDTITSKQMVRACPDKSTVKTSDLIRVTGPRNGKVE